MDIGNQWYNNHLFYGKSKYLSPIVGTLSKIPLNKYSLGLQELMISDNNKYLSLICSTRNLIGAVSEERAFSTAGHLLAIKEDFCDK